MGFSFVEKINEKIYIGTMSNSRDTYLIRQLKTRTLAYHILLSIGMGKKEEKLHETPLYK